MDLYNECNIAHVKKFLENLLPQAVIKSAGLLLQKDRPGGRFKFQQLQKFKLMHGSMMHA